MQGTCIAVGCNHGKRGHWGPHTGLEGPVVAGIGLGLFIFWSRAARPNPVDEGGDFLRRQRFPLTVRRHAPSRVWITDPHNQQAGFRCISHHCRARVAAGEQQPCGVKSQPTFLSE